MRLLVTGPTDDLTKEQHEKLRGLLNETEDYHSESTHQMPTLLHSGRPGVEAAAASIAAELGWEIFKWAYSHDAVQDADHALVIWYSQGLPEPEEFDTNCPSDSCHGLADAGIPVDLRFL